MKKIIALVLSVLMCVGMLAACGGSKDTPATTAAPQGGDAPAETTAAPAADGKVYNFVVCNHDSATSMGEKWLETICNAVAEESNGRVTFTYNPGGSMFGAKETIDATKVGSCDICWATTGTYGGIFPLSEFLNLPGNGVTSGQLAAAVINTMFNEVPEVAAEYADWEVLAIHGTSLSPICTVNKKIETPADFSGLRLRVAGTIPTIYVNALGATATGMPTSEVYDSLSKNALDGMVNDWHNIDCFNLYEPVNYCLDVAVNMTTSFVLMNHDSYDQLPDDLKAIFQKYFQSGYAADMAGFWWDSCRYFVQDEMKENNVDIYAPSAEVEQFMWSDEVVNATHQGYIDYLNEKGFDGQAYYDKFMAIVDRFAGDYQNVWDAPFYPEDWTASADGYAPAWK